MLPEAERVFTTQERTVIKNWFTNPQNLKGLPPGLAKREKLPPGLERQLKERGTLPPGLQRRFSPCRRNWKSSYACCLPAGAA